MKTIWKYEITANETIQIKVPKESKFLTVLSQFDSVFMWCLVDTDNELETLSLKVCATGQELSKDFDGTYLGTFFVHGGHLVFHLFDVTQRIIS